jgi:hypothetical protein
MIIGHLHVPFVSQFDGVWLINPGAIASGNAFTRQTRQTVALLFLRDDGRPFVTHVDLAQPDQPVNAAVDWEAGFKTALDRYCESIAEPGVARIVAAVGDTPYAHDRRLWAAFSRPGMSRWLGETDQPITAVELIRAIAADEAFTAAEHGELLRLIEGAVALGMVE